MNVVDMRTLAACFDLPENMAIAAVYPAAAALTILPTARFVTSPLSASIASTAGRLLMFHVAGDEFG